MTEAQLRPLAIGEVLDVAFSLYRKHFVALATVAMISQAAAILLSVFVEASGGLLEHPALWGASLVVGMICTAVGMGASTKIVADAYLGREVQAAAAIGWVVPHLGKIIVLSMVSTLIVGIGFLLLVIPGIVIGTGVAVSACALVVEGLSPIDSLNRSWNLTKGHRWKVFGTLLVALLLVYMVSFVAVFIGGVAGLVLGLGSSSVTTGVLVIAAVSAVLSVLVYPFIYSAVTVLYYDLRVRKEGFDLEILESQLEAL
ncbi:MAG: YciC family protein [Gemmatimonadales bacterium]